MLLLLLFLKAFEDAGIRHHVQAHLLSGSLLPSSSRLMCLDAPLACLRYFMNSSVRLRVAPAAPLAAMMAQQSQKHLYERATVQHCARCSQRLMENVPMAFKLCQELQVDVNACKAWLAKTKRAARHSCVTQTQLVSVIATLHD